MPLLEIKDLRIDFGWGSEAVRAVDGVSLSLDIGQTLCLVGESGSGKSVTALSVARLLPGSPNVFVSGDIRLDGREVLKLDSRELRALRGGVVSYVFQEPAASLNPVMRIGSQIGEAVRLHRPEVSQSEEVVRLLRLVGIAAPEDRARCYPHELSGGMQQRVMIAMALAARPKLLIADEPTTALDVTIQAQIIELLGQLKQQLGMAILLITHNLGIVGDLGERVAVMYAGQIVEMAPVRDLLQRPLHPYTQALIQSVPRLGEDVGRLASIPGTVPPPAARPTGCRFHPRCSVARPECSQLAPALTETTPQRLVRCPYAETRS